MESAAYKGRRVLVTGHTGFKGSWLCEWLLLLGAEVHGFALEPPTTPSLFVQLNLMARLASDTRGDVRDLEALSACLQRVKPDFVFHLAAQPLVRESYRTPAETFAVNVMGTVNVLEAVRRLGFACTVVCITTDKVYENDNAGRAFVEADPLGGCDPYSASKGACEIAIASYRRSFFAGEESRVRVASARAGNVIGGGDWAADRLVPRNRHSTRPWQHVLEPLCGYLTLGARLVAGELPSGDGASDMSFNFGPDAGCMKTVGDLVEELCKAFPQAEVRDDSDPQAPKEATLLQLDSSKAQAVLGWMPRWSFAQTVAATVTWYKAVSAGEEASAWCRRQIEEYVEGNLKEWTVA